MAATKSKQIEIENVQSPGRITRASVSRRRKGRLVEEGGPARPGGEGRHRTAETKPLRWHKR
jgi:hypothetical protein